MPELPEVETVARGLRHLAGQKLRTLELFDQRVWFESEGKPAAFANRTLREVTRRGKYLIFRFDAGLSLVGHLRMTGKFLPESSAAIPAPVRAVIGEKKGKGLQVRARLRFERDTVVFFDTRRFGTLTAVTDEEKFFTKKKIAPDPLTEGARAREIFVLAMQARRKRPVKALLLDQAAVAGVGNIYADEALHRVGVHPKERAPRVKRIDELWQAILGLLESAIAAGGTTVYDYLHADGTRGEYSAQLKVYGRTGEPCFTCGSKVERIVLGGRSTHFCSRCQARARKK